LKIESCLTLNFQLSPFTFFASRHDAFHQPEHVQADYDRNDGCDHDNLFAFIGHKSRETAKSAKTAGASF